MAAMAKLSVSIPSATTKKAPAFPVYIGHGYSLVRELRSGAFGDVYEGRDRAGNPVAIKEIKPNRTKQTKIGNRLLPSTLADITTLTALSDIQHPNIVRLLDVIFVGQDQDPANFRMYVVMEFGNRGGTLPMICGQSVLCSQPGFSGCLPFNHQRNQVQSNWSVPLIATGKCSATPVRSGWTSMAPIKIIVPSPWF